MKIIMINQYTAEDMKNATVKAELAEVFKVEDTFDWTGSYGLDLHDPAGCIAALPVRTEMVDAMRVYHCCFKPEQSSIQEAKFPTDLCADIASKMASVCHWTALASPIAFAIHINDDFRTDVVFSNVNSGDGSIEEDALNDLLNHMKDIA